MLGDMFRALMFVSAAQQAMFHVGVLKQAQRL